MRIKPKEIELGSTHLNKPNYSSETHNLLVRGSNPCGGTEIVNDAADRSCGILGDARDQNLQPPCRRLTSET